MILSLVQINEFLNVYFLIPFCVRPDFGPPEAVIPLCTLEIGSD